MITISFRVEQKIKGKIYVYEATSFWDKKKKQSRQKRIYLGKKDPESGQLIPGKKTSFPSLSFGSLYLLKKISSSLQLTQILSRIFPNNYKKYLSLAFFKISQAESYYLYHYWQENQFMSEDSQMSSQTISRLLLQLGRNEKKVELFFKKWIQLNNEEGTVMFDITSLSSYSKTNEILELGYNKPIPFRKG